MKINQISLSETNWHTELRLLNLDANLLVLFVSLEYKLKYHALKTISNCYPKVLKVVSFKKPQYTACELHHNNKNTVHDAKSLSK